MATIPVKRQTVDMSSGEVTGEEAVAFTIMPPRNPKACPTCGREHAPEQPHDAQQLHYQYTFYGEHGRWPTWKDAVEHCSDDVKQLWEKTLRAIGKWSEPETGQ